MSSAAAVVIHRSQFPENVRRDLLASLRTRRVNHKFHYDSVRQTQKWLALHQAFSPSRIDPDCAAIYNQSFAAAAASARSGPVHLLGLGCGGGQKDTRLLKRLSGRGRKVFYTPCDVSVAMVLVARKAALAVVPESACFPFVCDLARTDDLPAALQHTGAPRAGVQRLVTFFGMIPNFEPEQVLPGLAGLIRRNDRLLFSANLAPGTNYAAGMKKILPQYDNPFTRDWLMTFLIDLGVEPRDGRLQFTVEPGGRGLKRVAARFVFQRRREIVVDAKRFKFRPADSVRLFFSYRYTPELVRQTLSRYGLKVLDRWVTRSGEEGVFLCGRS